VLPVTLYSWAGTTIINRRTERRRSGGTVNHCALESMNGGGRPRSNNQSVNGTKTYRSPEQDGDARDRVGGNQLDGTKHVGARYTQPLHSSSILSVSPGSALRLHSTLTAQKGQVQIVKCLPRPAGTTQVRDRHAGCNRATQFCFWPPPREGPTPAARRGRAELDLRQLRPQWRV